MAFSDAELLMLKNDMAANTATVDIGGVMTPINEVPQTPDNAFVIAAWYNLPANYWVWRESVSRSQVYNTTSDLPSSWDWTFYKNQSVTEQNAWTQMFMGDQADFSKLNLRVGISKIFTAGSSVNRDHAFAVGRKKCNSVEKLLFTQAVTNPPANSGNDGVSGNRGKTTNPDVLSQSASVNYQDIQNAWSTS